MPCATAQAQKCRAEAVDARVCACVLLGVPRVRLWLHCAGPRVVTRRAPTDADRYLLLLPSALSMPSGTSFLFALLSASASLSCRQGSS